MNTGTVKRYPLHIRFNDIDAYGIVNNATYITYFEEGRMRWFHDRVPAGWNWENEGVLVARHEINYLAPLRLGDRAEIALHIPSWGNKSFQVHYTIYVHRDAQWIPCTEGITVMVCFDYVEKKTAPLPAEWVEIFAKELA